MEKKGVIYILTNPSFPEYVKIGYATDIEKRLKELNRSETIPFAFRVYAVYEVYKELTDKKLHKLIDTINPDLRAIEEFDGKKRTKEFYVMSPEDAYNLLECISEISGTTDRLKKMKPEGHELEDEKKADEERKLSRKGPLCFSKCNIPVDSELVFIEDESVKVRVVDDRHVNYNGEITSLSALVKKLKKSPSAVQGTLYFTYNGVKLTDIREQLNV